MSTSYIPATSCTTTRMHTSNCLTQSQALVTRADYYQLDLAVLDSGMLDTNCEFDHTICKSCDMNGLYLGAVGALCASSSCCRGMSAARRARAGAITAEPLRCLGLPGAAPDMSCCRGRSADLLAIPGATIGVSLHKSNSQQSGYNK